MNTQPNRTLPAVTVETFRNRERVAPVEGAHA